MERARNMLAVDVIVTVCFSKDQIFLCCSDANQLFPLKQTHSDS